MHCTPAQSRQLSYTLWTTIHLVIVLICTHLLVQMSSSHLQLETTAQHATAAQAVTAYHRSCSSSASTSHSQALQLSLVWKPLCLVVNHYLSWYCCPYRSDLYHLIANTIVYSIALPLLSRRHTKNGPKVPSPTLCFYRNVVTALKFELKWFRKMKTASEERFNEEIKSTVTDRNITNTE